jgi:hypothetical protein
MRNEGSKRGQQGEGHQDLLGDNERTVRKYYARWVGAPSPAHEDSGVAFRGKPKL